MGEVATFLIAFFLGAAFIVSIVNSDMKKYRCPNCGMEMNKDSK